MSFRRAVRRIAPLVLASSWVLFGAVRAAAGAAAPVPQSAQPHGEIIWDSYGIPHIFAKNVVGLYYGFGYAQAQAHGDLLLHLYGESRGRAAEYWGAEFEAADRYLLANDVWERARTWYAAQTPAMRDDLDAFAAGIDAYASEHPERIAPSVRVVLPVTGLDVIAHWEHVMEFLYLAPPSKAYGAGPGGLAANRGALRAEPGSPDPAAGSNEEAGSNAWAIAPAKTVDGHAMLLSNPHLQWAPSFMTYFEAHLSAPGVEMYGATQVGFPVLRFSFNADHGLTNTVNPISAATTYQLTLAGNGYRYDGKVRRFRTRAGTITVKQPDGTLQTHVVELRQSIQGPVFTRADGTTVALRVAGLDRPFGIQEYWDLDNAVGLQEFVAILRRLQIPMFNLVYADRDGHILYQYNGDVPVRAFGDFAYWSGLVPGDTSKTLWTRIHPYEDLPRTLDPPAGWVQNTNNPPWVNTALPALDPARFPAYLSPVSMTLRAEQSALLLMSRPRLTFDEFVKLKMSTRSLMADRLLDPLLAAAAASRSPLVKDAAALLKDWDHHVDNDSRAALLFETWARGFAGPQFLGTDEFARPWDSSAPLSTPDGIKDPDQAVALLETAARDTIALYGALDRPFGDISRFRLGDVDLPGNGGFGNLGIFRVITWSPMKDGHRTPLHGETYISAIEFTTPMKAMGLMSYGQSTQPGSPHRSDQLGLLSKQQLRPIWLTRAEAEQHRETQKEF
jgi:acyl-homoserine-lactone acylase